MIVYLLLSETVFPTPLGSPTDVPPRAGRGGHGMFLFAVRNGSRMPCPKPLVRNGVPDPDAISDGQLPRTGRGPESRGQDPRQRHPVDG